MPTITCVDCDATPDPHPMGPDPETTLATLVDCLHWAPRGFEDPEAAPMVALGSLDAWAPMLLGCLLCPACLSTWRTQEAVLPT